MNALLATIPSALEPWLILVGQGLLSLLAALIAHRIGSTALAALVRPQPLLAALLRHLHSPTRGLFILAALQVVLRAAPDALSGMGALRHANDLALIVALTWVALRSVSAIATTVVDLHPADVENNLEARRLQTQTMVLSRSLMSLVTLIGFGAALMTFPGVRQFGAGLLASAGVAGLVVGFAAKPVLGNLLAGLQIALTQPIRLDDVVIVEGEWGRIEEITGTYVVVHLWDQRRLIVPLQWFIEHPFQNWTRSSADILGSVFIWADYATPIDSLRKEARRICAEAPEWDRRICQIQVTDASERAQQLRVLVSAADSSRCWDLRCKLREGLIEFLQREFPASLPRVRAELFRSEEDPPSGGAAGQRATESPPG